MLSQHGCLKKRSAKSLVAHFPLGLRLTKSESPGAQFYLCPTPRQVTEHCSNVICNPFSYVFLSPSHFRLFPSLPHSLILSLFFLYPTLPPTPLPSPISFLSSFLPSISPPYHPYLPIVSSLFLPPPVLALCLITDTIIRTKGQHLGSGLGTLGSKRRPLCALLHPKPATTVCCSPWLLSELPQLRDRHSCSLQQKGKVTVLMACFVCAGINTLPKGMCLHPRSTRPECPEEGVCQVLQSNHHGECDGGAHPL